MLKYSKKTQVKIKERDNYLIFQSKNFFERHIGYIFPKHHIENGKLCFDDKNFKNTYVQKRQSLSKKIIEKFNSIDRDSLTKGEKILLDNFQIEWLSAENLYMDKDRSIRIRVWGVQSKYIEHLDKDYISPEDAEAQKIKTEQHEKNKKLGNIILMIILAIIIIFSFISRVNKQRRDQEQRRIEAIEYRKERIEERDSKMAELSWAEKNEKILLKDGDRNNITIFKNGGQFSHTIINNSEFEIEMIVQNVEYYKKSDWFSSEKYWTTDRDTILLSIDSPKGKPGNTDTYTHPSTFKFRNSSKYTKDRDGQFVLDIYGYKPVLK